MSTVDISTKEPALGQAALAFRRRLVIVTLQSRGWELGAS